ncbi:DUF3352 domain-containing protein [Candidatus Peregrinibacteria bacterium]|jgi:hypothetical protein|nr:DUF3352 domain-containing protein [Candidatus Peregrinibacteria bacterium]MBT7483475.1 DUF3352 domain-containing protein [Candidatus Peregrinibacteria bacterium]MBT7702698.1 DUF3352 domain-containing protein [Candidatus Peregrinibacteria bacterium]
MFKKYLPHALVSVVLASSFLFSGCLNGPTFYETHQSQLGYLIEETLPHDTWFSFSISTLNEAQRTSFQNLIARFSDDADDFRTSILSGIDENLATVDLSYIEDIQPILGEEGLRFMFALSDGDDAPVMHAGLTLDNPEKAEDLFDELIGEGRFVRKVVKDYDLYFNVYAEEEGKDVFYFGLYEDLMLIANDSDEVAEMLDLAKSQGDYSLWSKDVYQAVIEELPVEHVGFMFMDGEYLAERRGDLAGMSLAEGVTPYLAGQGMAFVGMPEGLQIRGIALGDRAKIDEADVSLDELQAKKSYLMKDMPGLNLGAYIESYDLAAVLDRQLGEGSAGMLGSYLALLGLDPTTDLAEILSEGYAIALHANNSALPGLTIMIDISDGIELAQELMTNIDAQITGLLGVFSLQGGPIAEALSKEEIEIDGLEFDKIELDLDALMSVYDTSGTFELPVEIQGQTVNLIYGITKDHRLVISNYDGWLDDPKAMLEDVQTYEEVQDYLKGFKEGMMFIDFAEIMEFMDAFEAFRDALRSDAEVLESDTVVIEVEDEVDEDLVEALAAEGIDVEVVTEGELAEGNTIDLKEFIAPLKSFGFSADATKYEVKLGGVILLEEE